MSIEVAPSQLDGERHIFQYPQFWSFSHSYLALPFQMTPHFVEVMSIKFSVFLHNNLILVGPNDKSQNSLLEYQRGKRILLEVGLTGGGLHQFHI